jgi:GntR family transcriptional repressor for pyruvate dehydrogenase complex
MLGVSRPTLREALTTLATLGVLEIQTGVGTFVRSATIDEQLAIQAVDLLSTDESPVHALETRLLIEPDIAALAATRAEEQNLHYMRQALREIRSRVGRNEAFQAAGMNFHMAIVRSIRNPVAEHACTIPLAIWFSNPPGWGDIVRSIVTQPGRLARYCANYERIYEAIKSGDSQMAAKTMRDHLQEVREDLLRQTPTKKE